MQLSQKRQDAYIANPALLNGKPKETTGRYAKKNGILVPEIYDSLWDARKSGKSLIARSESQWEYSGASGICESLKINNNNGRLEWGQIVTYRRQPGYEALFPKPTSENNIRAAVLLASLEGLERHANLMDLGIQKQLDSVTFSLWERLPGLNVKILGDSSIEGKYHVTAYDYRADASGLATYNNGKTAIHSSNNLGDFFSAQKNKLIGFYEQVCNLENFDPLHRPVVEAQYADGKLYFLQYHRCRDFEPAVFVLERQKMKGEHEATLVRGATPPEGIVAKTTLYYRHVDTSLVNDAPEEEGAFNTYYDPVFTNTLAGKRKLQIITGNNFSHDCANLASSHDPFSQFAKPAVSIFTQKTAFPQMAYSKLLWSDSI